MKKSDENDLPYNLSYSSLLKNSQTEDNGGIHYSFQFFSSISPCPNQSC